MKNGRLYQGDTLDEVYPRQKPLETQWWWNHDAADIGTVAPAEPDVLLDAP